MSLYVGANYHPHDWEPERWPIDIELMKQAGFTTVRLGHLCWDSYEPEDGVYAFEWFDRAMDLFAEAGIGVVLDVSTRPAPGWVHRLCPGCNIHDKNGTHMYSLRRYMEDVDDPEYQKYALRFANVLVKRYREHPALFAFGLCNELGDGYMSYSGYARKRFIAWLKAKYKTVDNLNKAWATQRWSRRLPSFDEAVLQENEAAIGPPEAWLDMRRFYSDGIGGFASALAETVQSLAPGVPHSSNHFSTQENLGFDLLKYAKPFVDVPGIGFYPGFSPSEGDMLPRKLLSYMYRIAETDKPMWCLEFQTGGADAHSDNQGINRMYAFLALLHRAQMVLGWTFRSMLNGEEQFYHGILDHDGTPTRNYDVYKRIASDFKELEKYGFPYLPKPETALAYSYESSLITMYHQRRFRQAYPTGLTNVLSALEKRNMDFNVVNLRDLKRDYKLLIVPGHVIMDEASANTVRDFAAKGGTVIMTGNSAVMDGTARVFDMPKPGGLADVFGIRVAGFERPGQPLKVRRGGEVFSVELDYREEIDLRGAVSHADFEDNGLCAVSRNTYGRGRAFYVAAQSNTRLMDWLIQSIAEETGLSKPLETPEGIYARRIAENQYFYVNITDGEINVPLAENGRGVLSGENYRDTLPLAPYDGELIVKK
jgi:beta-galactosidase